MDHSYEPILSEEERARRRAQRAAARKRKQRARRRRLLLQTTPFLLLAVLLTGVLVRNALNDRKKEPAEQNTASISAAAPEVLPEKPEEPSPAERYAISSSPDTIQLGEALPSAYAVVVDRASGTILAEKSSETVISPASMTKILTLLVAVEHLKSLEDTVPITIEITDYCYVNDCSVVGYEVGETATVRELLYGTILSSGADAALALATYVAGSHEAFVDLMNEKLAELGLSDTAHFTNCVGLYDKEHHCTVRDMAVILNAAMDEPLCREVLSAHTYETAPTEFHPDGQVLSNWFLRKIEDHDKEQPVRAVGAKTGYVAQSGSCAASWGENSQGQAFICVTGNAYSAGRAIYDHVELYKTYCS